jgi:diguanylate cyclase (GGDEF)-like protein
MMRSDTSELNEAERRALELLGVGLVVIDRAAGASSAVCNVGARRLLGLASAGGDGEAGTGWKGDSSLSSALSDGGELCALLAAGEGKTEMFSGEGPSRRRIEACVLSLAADGTKSVIVLRDITANAALLEELSTLASKDALTGILNRRCFDELCSRDIVLARRALSSVSVLMIDIDLFKRVNDEHGHSVGDEALKAVTKACAETLRSTDILGRYGGEEFAVLLPTTGASESLLVAERLRARVAAIALPCEGGHISLTISIGVYSGVPAPDDDISSYLRRADEALYRSKALGRNKASFWTAL